MILTGISGIVMCSFLPGCIHVTQLHELITSHLFHYFWHSLKAGSTVSMISTSCLLRAAANAVSITIIFINYTLSHPENDRDVTERAQVYTLQDTSFIRQSRCSFLNAWENTQVARYDKRRSRGETKYIVHCWQASRHNLLSMLKTIKQKKEKSWPISHVINSNLAPLNFCPASSWCIEQSSHLFV